MDPSLLLSLPSEMIMLIMVAVLSDTIGDFIKFRSCCRKLHGIGSSTDLVMTMVPYSIVPREQRQQLVFDAFVDHFIDQRNPEALYRLGMHTFLKQIPRQLNLGFAQLKAAAHRRHDIARFAAAMIMIFNWPGDEKLVDEAFALLTSLVVDRRAPASRRVFIDGVRRLTEYSRRRPSHPTAPARRCKKHNLNVVYRIAGIEVYVEFAWCIACFCDAQVVHFRYENYWAEFPHRLPKPEIQP